MRAILRLASLIALVLALPLTVFAAGRLIVVDEGNRADRAQIEAAAAPLLARDALVAVYLVERGDDAEFERLLRADDLLRDGLMRSQTLAVFIAFDDRYSAIAYGDAFESALGVNENFERIRTDVLNPALADGAVTEAVTATLAEFERAIANPPPRVGGLQIIFDTLPIVGGVLLLVAVAAGAFVFIRVRRGRQQEQARDRKLREARESAGGAIVELGLKFRAADEEAVFDRVSLSPAFAAELAAAVQPLRAALQEQQTQFDQIGERLNRDKRPPDDVINWAVQGYLAISAALAALPAALADIAARRNRYQEDFGKLAAAVDQLTARREAVVAAFQPYAAELPQPDTSLAALDELIGAAAIERQGNDADRLRTALEAAQAAIDLTIMLLETLTGGRRELVAIRRSLTELEAEGYRLEAAHQQCDLARTAQVDALHALAAGDRAAAQAALSTARDALDAAIRDGTALPALREENDRRIAQLEQRGPQVAARLAAGRTAFDLVDEFAESCWRDIAGNGSEAEAAADLAEDRWQEARGCNTLERQEFHLAADHLGAAEAALDHVEQLITAIEQRLADLERARSTARSLMDEARRSLEAGRSYLSANDAMIGSAPEQQLRSAAELLARAEQEAQQAQPDWLQLVADAGRADQLADAALADAGAQVAATERMQQRWREADELTAAAVRRVENYLSVHGADVDPSRAAALAQLSAAVTRLRADVDAGHTLEDLALRRALGDGVQRQGPLQQQAAELLKAAEGDVQAVEGLRSEVNAALNEAAAQVERMMQTLQVANAAHLAQRSTAVQARLRSVILPLNGREKLQAALQTAREVSAEARAITDAALPLRQSVPSAQATSSIGDVLAGIVIGSLLDGRHSGGWGHSGGWSSPHSGRSSSSGWGRSGGGGGSFGGSHRGGSFGGGRRGGKW